MRECTFVDANNTKAVHPEHSDPEQGVSEHSALLPHIRHDDGRFQPDTTVSTFDDDIDSNDSSYDIEKKNAWDHYSYHLERNPLLVKSVTAFFILGLADLGAQCMEHVRGGGSTPIPSMDLLRSVRFGIFGFLGAPWSHYYFHYLDTVFPPTSTTTATTNLFSTTTFVKLAVDQFIQAPLMLAIIICGLRLISFEGIAAMKQAMMDHYWPSLTMNWKLWIPASLMNLAFVPPKLRVLYVNGVFFLWIVFLSMLLQET